MEPKKKNYTNIIIILLIILIVVLGGVFFVKSLSSKKTDDTNTNTTPTPTSTATTTPSTSPTDTTSPTVTVSDTPTPSTSVTPTPSTTDTPTPTPTTGFTGSLRVFYSKDPESINNPSYVFYFNKTTNRSDYLAFAIERIIAGPTASEVTNYKVFTPLKLSGSSNCGGKDFTLNVDSANKKATLKFCKTVDTSGVGTDARVKGVVSATLKQFGDIQTVIILTSDDNCFGDLSGRNTCKS